MIYRILIFLLINFLALAIGGMFTNTGVNSEWYANLDKAPWTPPGWVFGVAWSTIMICFSLYMTYLWSVRKDKIFLVGLFSLQWILNVAWNPIFFYYRATGIGLMVIVLLTLLIGFLLFYFMSTLKYRSFLIAPYLLWLLVATSLNWYIVVNN